ncbi:MAG: OmpH family outer membrane protein [Planctomycetales bacterium]|nr:OmpH family outer membrane protein [Planctomycetales bacterium]
MSVRVFIATLILGACVQVQVFAQATPAVAVIDIGYILENHPSMKQEVEQIQKEMEAASAEMVKKRDQIIKQMEMLRQQYTEGTAEYEQQEKKIAEADTALRLELVKQQKQFDERQATVLFSVYNDVKTLVKAAADGWKAQVVLRVSRQEMDVKKPETVDFVMRQDVIYYNPGIDLTDWVLEQLKAKAGNTASRPGAAPR